MTPVLKTNRRLLLWNIVRYTFPNQAVDFLKLFRLFSFFKFLSTFLETNYGRNIFILVKNKKILTAVFRNVWFKIFDPLHPLSGPSTQNDKFFFARNIFFVLTPSQKLQLKLQYSPYLKCKNGSECGMACPELIQLLFQTSQGLALLHYSHGI